MGTGLKPLLRPVLIIYQKLTSIATKYAQFADHAAPLMDSGVNLMSTAVSATLKIAEVHCVTVLLAGEPSAVRHAEEV